jgi:hypothetical protein
MPSYIWNGIEIREGSMKDWARQNLEELHGDFAEYMRTDEWITSSKKYQQLMFHDVNAQLDKLTQFITGGPAGETLIDYTFSDPHSDSNVAGFEYVWIAAERNGFHSAAASADALDVEGITVGFARQLKAIFTANESMPAARKCALLSRFALIAGGLVLEEAQAAVGTTLMRRATQNKGDADILVSQALKDATHTFVQHWRSEPDAAYWARFAKATELGVPINGTRVDYTIADHVMFMNCTIDLAPMQELWSWDEPADLVQNVLTLKSFYDASPNTLAGLYAHVLDATYQGRPMPRAVAAQQLQCALALIAHDLRDER